MSPKAVVVVLFAVAACSGSKSAGGAPDKDTATAPTEGQKIAVPGAGKGSAITAAPAADDPRFHLQPEEGTLTIDKAQVKAGEEVAANLKVAPADGYHIATDFPIKVSLEAPEGVTLAKTELTAGGHDKAQGDAVTLSEQMLAFVVRATAAKAGAYEIKGTLKFGVCAKDACHPKKQPITIAVAVN